MPIQIKIPNHMIMPFGCNGWNFNDIQMSGVSTDGTYITSRTNCVHIDLTSCEPLRLAHFMSFFPDEKSNFPLIYGSIEALFFMRNYLKENCKVDTDHERTFLDLYFEHVLSRIQNTTWYWKASGKFSKAETDNSEANRILKRAFLALMPFPQAHIYARNPFVEPQEQDFIPDRMFRVDFAFWTGRQLIAVEIDGGSHIGNPRHVEKDRMLARAGVRVVHILNSEIDEYGGRVIPALMPESIVDYGPTNELPEGMDEYELNPFSDEIPF